jgi:DNA-binding CsgD family transcriptional regulator
MTRRPDARQAEREVVQLCHRGLDVADVHSRVLQTLRRAVPIEAAFFATADPETLLFTHAYAEEPLDAATGPFLANEFGSPDVNKFSALARSSTHVSTLDGATRNDRSSSLRSRDILAPLGLGDELRAALVAGSQCWGYLCLHRGDTPLGFTEKEIALIARLGPHIAQALRHALVMHHITSLGDEAGPGVVVLAEDLTVVAVTAQAEYLLGLMGDTQSPKAPLPLPVYAVAKAVCAVPSRDSTLRGPPGTKIPAADGRWLYVHASRLDGDQESRIAVVIEAIEPRAAVPLLLAAHGLSPREVEVARLVLRGESTRAIVDRLHISKHTVQDHLKSVFNKTGARSRRDLVGQFLASSRTPS